MSLIHLYVDGSCGDNRNVTKDTIAGWGVCIVSGDSGTGRGQGEVMEETSGRVVTDPAAPGYIGASVGSNNTAELSAIAHALRWLLINGEDNPARIRSDSSYASNLATGAWKPKTNKEIVRRVRELWIECESARPLSIEHIRAHRGHRWNERADHLAYRAMEGRNPEPLQFWKPGLR